MMTHLGKSEMALESLPCLSQKDPTRQYPVRP